MPSISIDNMVISIFFYILNTIYYPLRNSVCLWIDTMLLHKILRYYALSIFFPSFCHQLNPMSHGAPCPRMPSSSYSSVCICLCICVQIISHKQWKLSWANISSCAEYSQLATACVLACLLVTQSPALTCRVYNTSGNTRGAQREVNVKQVAKSHKC